MKRKGIKSKRKKRWQRRCRELQQEGKGKEGEKIRKEKERKKRKEEKSEEEKRKETRKKGNEEGNWNQRRAGSRIGWQRTHNWATRGRFPPTSVILRLGAT